MDKCLRVIGFALSITFIVFVCTRLICARILSIASRRSARTSRSDLSNFESGFNDRDHLTLANFPTKKYGELCSSSYESARCVVCLSDYHEEDSLCILPICGHSFHTTCIGIWLQQRSTCPVCRVSLGEVPRRKWFMQPMSSSALRSQYTAHYCSCMANGNRYLLRSHETETMDPIQEDRRDRGYVGGSNSNLINHQLSIKN